MRPWPTARWCRPPPQFLGDQTGLKALLNLGAGAHAVLSLQLPPDVPVVRLDVAGMAVQMAEYVSYPVICHFCEFCHFCHFCEFGDDDDAAAVAGQWSCCKPQLREDLPVGVMGVLGQRVYATLG